MNEESMITFDKLKKEHQENLITLRDGLVKMYGTEEYNSNFSMNNYQVESGWRSGSFTEHTCNTSACVLGHGPVFGIGTVESGEWGDYCANYFGIEASPYSQDTWDFLFSAEWDDNIQEAIARLTVYIDGFDTEVEPWDYDTYYAE